MPSVPYDWSRWGERVKTLREGRDWSQDELARRLNIHRVSLARLEGGTRKPSVEVLERLADVFRLSLWDLMRPRRTR